jgi:excisionase family DNA binding protein
MQSTTGRTDAYASATEWLTSDEAALYLKVERRTLLQWVRQGKVRAHVLSGTQRHVRLPGHVAFATLHRYYSAVRLLTERRSPLRFRL